MTTEELRESLLAAPKNGYAALTAQQREEMEAYAPVSYTHLTLPTILRV